MIKSNNLTNANDTGNPQTQCKTEEINKNIGKTRKKKYRS